MLTTQELNKVLQEILNIEPILEFKEPMPESSHEMKFGQAQIYALKGFRDYITNEINRAIKNAALSADNELQGAVFKGRIITLKELLIKSKQSFQELEKLKQRAINE